jgi:uncharacterized OsmC-like protein
MKLQCVWNDKMRFTAEADSHEVAMDAKSPIGSESAMTPKQLVVAAICGCTAMLSKAVPISYTVELNAANIGAGNADFK